MATMSYKNNVFNLKKQLQYEKIGDACNYNARTRALREIRARAHVFFYLVRHVSFVRFLGARNSRV